MLDKWQENWEQSDKGRITFYFFPSVTDRLRLRCFQPDRILSQVFTGHGAFREYLARHRLAESPLCPDCGYLDSSVHALLFCPAVPDPGPSVECLRLMLHASSGGAPLTPEALAAVRERASRVLKRRELLRV